jgi:hypothetical protein
MFGLQNTTSTPNILGFFFVEAGQMRFETFAKKFPGTRGGSRGGGMLSDEGGIEIAFAEEFAIVV